MDSTRSAESETHYLLDDVGARVEVDQPLVYPHLVPVPRLRAFPTWPRAFISPAPVGRWSDLEGSGREGKGRDQRLPRGVLEDFGRQSHGAFHAEVAVFGAVDQVAANYIQSAGVPASGKREDDHISREA